MTAMSPQGGDWGSAVTTTIASMGLAELAGVHLNMVVAYPDEADMEDLQLLPNRPRWRAPSIIKNGAAAMRNNGEPQQTLGYGLANSPAGQAAWIYEKFFEWTDCDGDPRNILTLDEILDNIMLYWLTNSATSSARLYWESFHNFAADPIDIPVGLSVFPKEIISPSRRWAERKYKNIIHWNTLDRGGHFAALSNPKSSSRKSGERSACFVEARQQSQATNRRVIMKKGYVIAIRDRTMIQQELETYAQKAVPTLAGARLLVAYGPHEAREGAPSDGGVAVLEFDSYDAAREWYDSPAYADARAHRFKGAESPVHRRRAVVRHLLIDQTIVDDGSGCRTRYARQMGDCGVDRGEDDEGNAMGGDRIRFERDGGLATITLCRPEVGNALDDVAGREIRDIAIKCVRNSDIRAVLLLSEGKNFCVGGDMGFVGKQADPGGSIRAMTVDFHAAMLFLADGRPARDGCSGRRDRGRTVDDRGFRTMWLRQGRRFSPMPIPESG